jgi:hypothetical protein
VYSPAKRRGPVPGRAGQTRKASEAFANSQQNNRFHQPRWSNADSAAGVSPEALQTLGDVASRGGMLPAAGQSIEELHMRQMMIQQLGGGPGGLSGIMGGGGLGGVSGPSTMTGMAGGGPLVGSMGQPQDSFLDTQQQAIQQQLNLIQRLQAQQMANDVRGGNGLGGPGVLSAMEEQAAMRRMKMEHNPKQQQLLQQRQLHLQQGMEQQKLQEGIEEMQQQQQQQQMQQQQQQQSNGGTDSNGVPKTIAAHTHLLELSDPDGSRLRAYYRLSVDEVFGFPPTPTDEEYCTRLNILGMTPRMIPGTHLAALSAARFAEVALGAIVHNEVPLAMELCNAVVHCLKESVQEPVQPPYMFEVARSYFLLAVFRSFRGDMVRYFKYRRVCLTYVSKLDVGILFCLQ